MSLLFPRLTCPPMEIPVMPRGPNPTRSHQFSKTIDSSTSEPPITNRSLTFCRLDLLKK